MKQTISLKDVRSQLSELIAKVAYGKQNVVITRFGKPVATLVSYEDYERMMNPRKRFSGEEWEKGFALINKVRENTKKYPQKRVEKAIDEAVAEVRAKKHVQGSS